MEEICAAATKGAPTDEVEELILDNFRGRALSPEDKTCIEKFASVEFLTLISVGLRTLDNFPVLPKLLKLDLSDNKIESGFEAFAPLTELMSLILANNWVKTVNALRPLGVLPELVSIDLFQCPVASSEGYREMMFEAFPKLEILDGTNQAGEDASLGSDSDEDSEDSQSQASDLIASDRDEEPPASEPAQVADEPSAAPPSATN